MAAWDVHIQTHGVGKFKPTGTVETNKPFADKYYANRTKESGHNYKLVPREKTMTTESVDQFIQSASQGDQKSANLHLGQALMDKVSEKLDAMKVDIANRQFGFSNESKEYECPYCGKMQDDQNAACCGEKGHMEKVKTKKVVSKKQSEKAED